VSGYFHPWVLVHFGSHCVDFFFDLKVFNSFLALCFSVLRLQVDIQPAPEAEAEGREEATEAAQEGERAAAKTEEEITWDATLHALLPRGTQLRTFYCYMGHNSTNPTAIWKREKELD
jgi:cytochrome c1